MTEKQLSIIDYLKRKGNTKKAELYVNSKFIYYHNWEKHFGEVLSRLVKSGHIIRVSKGVYAFNEEANSKITTKEEQINQLKLI